MRNLPMATMRNVALAAATILALGATNAWADSDTEAVKAAQTAYIAAVDSVDPAKLEALWAHDDTVMDYEPGSKSVAVGWEAVKKNRDNFPMLYAELKNTIEDGPHIQIKGDMARFITKTGVLVKMKDGAERTGEILQTDIYEKRNGAWLLVSHSASRVPK